MYTYIPSLLDVSLFPNPSQPSRSSQSMGVEKREPPCSVGINVNWYSYMENSKEVPKSLKTELPYDPTIPVIPLLGIYPEKIIIQKDTSWTPHRSTIYNSQGMEAT